MITGGISGIALATAKSFVEEGVYVVRHSDATKSWIKAASHSTDASTIWVLSEPSLS